MQFASLGSGSKGNSSIIKSKNTTLLIDCGFSLRQMEIRLQRLNINPETIDAILITHEHSDHICGTTRLANKYNIAVWASKGSSQKIALEQINIINIHQDFTIKDCQITPVAVPHDTKEPCQFVITSGEFKLGILTDVGHITSHIINCFNGCNGLMLETNYDEQLLQNGLYPEFLKARIRGNFGHLSNQQAGEFIKSIDISRLQKITLMHISQNNNSNKLAFETINNVIGNKISSPILADQETGFDWLEIN